MHMFILYTHIVDYILHVFINFNAVTKYVSRWPLWRVETG